MNGACRRCRRGRNCAIWLPQGRGGGGVGQTWQDIDLNPQIVCSNKLFQVRCHFPFALPPLLPLLPLFSLPSLLPSAPAPPARPGVVLGNALHLPGAISQWATRAGTIVVYTNNLLRAGKMHNSSPPPCNLPLPLQHPCCPLLLPLLRHFLIAQRSKFSAYCFSPPGHVLVHVADFDFGCVSPGSLAGAGVAVFIMAARVRRRRGHRQRCRMLPTAPAFNSQALIL